MGSRLRGAWRRFLPHAPFASLAVLVAAFYIPVVTTVYAFSTDYWLLLHARLRDGAIKAELVDGAGRLMDWFLIELSFLPAGSVPGLSGVRMLGLLLLSVFAWALGASCKRDLGRWPALSLAGAAMLLPSTAAAAYWASRWTLPIAALACLGAVHACRKAAVPDLEAPRAGGWAAGGVACVVVAALIDRAAWGLIPAFAFLLLIAPASDEIDLRAIKMVAAVAAGGLLLALTLALIASPGMRNIGSGLFEAPLARLGWYASGPLIDGALTVWAHPGGWSTGWFGGVVGITVNVALCAVWLRAIGRRAGAPAAARVVGAFAACLLVASLPILVAKETWIGYQPLWPLAMLWVCPVTLGAAEAIAWARRRGRHALVATALPLGVSVIVAGLLAHERLRIDLVGAQAQEWTLARFQAADAARSILLAGQAPAALAFVPPEPTCRWSIPGEAVPTSTLAWAQTAMVHLAADGLADAERRALLSLPVQETAAKERSALGAGTFDMRLAAFYGSMIGDCDPFARRP